MPKEQKSAMNIDEKKRDTVSSVGTAHELSSLPVQMAGDDAPSPPVVKKREKKPTVVIIIGMAGSGKTTMMQRINAHVLQHKIPSYIINLDPAVSNVPYEPNIDIRDTVNYKEVMRQYKLGPNGAILTSLNLFATRFDQVMDLINKRSSELEYIFIDTPGQIEVFTWSASGQIITESLAADFPTVMVYITDVPRSANPTTFMSNMTYACSIMYKTRLPFLIAFNKIDIMSHIFLTEWLTDADSMKEALAKDKTYMSSLVKSMGYVLEEFYKTINHVGVSAITGAGILRFFKALEKGSADYWLEYRPVLAAMQEKKRKQREQLKKVQIARIKKDIKASGGSKKVFSKTDLKKQVLDDLKATEPEAPEVRGFQE